MSFPFSVIAASPLPGVQAFCTTRSGGVGLSPYDSFNLGAHAGDDPAAVAENRARLRSVLPADPLWLRQVHGAAVWDADQAQPGVVPEADAAVSAQAGRVLAILTADCLPVVIAGGGALGVAHAGWRGLAAGVLEATVAAVRARATPQAPLQAWIGPAIGPDAFQVGSDVYQAFTEADASATAAFRRDPSHADKWLADLPALAEARLRAAGVETVVACGVCTVSDPRFFSYRRDGKTGRMATVAWLQDHAQSAPTDPVQP